MSQLTNMKSNLIFPLIAEDSVCGIITFPSYEEYLDLTDEEIENVQNYVFYISIAITSMFFYNELIDKNRIIREKNNQMNKDLCLAQKIQRNFVPLTPPDFPGVQLASIYQPMEMVGGDFFDFIRVRKPNLLGIFVSDVSGHGVPAALITSMLKSLVETSGATRLSPNQFLNYLNMNLIGQTSDNFLTAFYGVFNSETKILKYARAGHNYPFLLRDKKIIELASDGKILGIFDDQVFEEREIQLMSGDKVLFYTDGLTEAINARGVEFEEILPELLHEYAKKDINDFVDSIYVALQDFSSSQQFEDDICIIGMEVL